MSVIIPSRMAALAKARCAIFSQTYNPTGTRTGAKYLKARLRGPSMLNYYPKEINIASIIKEYPELELVNEDEKNRLQRVTDQRKRGKGPPRKAKSKDDSKRAQRNSKRKK